MLIAPAILTASGSATDASSYATASVTPTANALILASVFNIAVGPATPTASGNGLTWVAVASVAVVNNARTTLFRAMGASPTAGAITFDFGGQTQQNAHWTVTEVTGVDQSGTNGSGAVVQSATASGTSAAPSVTLAAFARAANGTYGVIGVNATDAITPGTGFTELSDTALVESNNIEDEWRVDNDTTVDWSIASNLFAAVAVEIGAGPQNTHPWTLGMALGMDIRAGGVVS